MRHARTGARGIRAGAVAHTKLVTRKAFIRAAWGVALALGLVVLGKTFVGDVYHVDTGSMEPTIHGLEPGGEWVFVRYDRSPPERGEIVVVLPPGESEGIVKRVAGKPLESVQIVDGDVWIDKKPLPPQQGGVRVTVFDDRWQDAKSMFHAGAAWKRENGVWSATVDESTSKGDDAWLDFHPPLADDYMTSDHHLVRGEQNVNDAVVECEVQAGALAGVLRIQLAEQGDVFELALEPATSPEGAQAQLVLRRTNADAGAQELARARVPFELAVWHHLRFGNVDNTLRVDCDAHIDVLRASYERNVAHPGDLQHEGKSIGKRLMFGVAGGTFRVRALRLQRDLYYTARGQFGISGPQQLGADEYFLLGDNSAHSRDSREWGPVSASWIIGRATRVVWPPSHWRSLAEGDDASSSTR